MHAAARWRRAWACVARCWPACMPGRLPRPSRTLANMSREEGRPAKQRKLLDQAASGNTLFARQLGSSDYHTREAGLSALQGWLASKDGSLQEPEALKLWKAVFYCYWHSDKLPVQVSGGCSGAPGSSCSSRMSCRVVVSLLAHPACPSALQTALAERLSEIMTKLPEEARPCHRRCRQPPLPGVLPGCALQPCECTAGADSAAPCAPTPTAGGLAVLPRLCAHHAA